jgi:hypothetical protein
MTEVDASFEQVLQLRLCHANVRILPLLGLCVRRLRLPARPGGHPEPESGGVNDVLL